MVNDNGGQDPIE